MGGASLHKRSAFWCTGVAALAVFLQGCGGGGGDEPTPAPTPPAPTPEPPPTNTTTTTITTTTPGPLKAMDYGALPVKAKTSTLNGPPPCMLQPGYEIQWGAKGRDDLANIKAFGANAVRLYHSIGIDTKHDHSGFLDRAAEVGLQVLPGIHSDKEDFTYKPPQKCGAEWDCHDYFKSIILTALKSQGYAKDGQWHPAIRTMILLNEPDFIEDQAPAACKQNRWCSNKVVLSAFEGLLSAEKEAGVEGTISITTCYSLAMRTSIDGKVTAPAIFGFQDIDAMTNDPSLAHYTPRTSQKELRDAFMTRWEHCVNVPTPWTVTLDAYNEWYNKGFHFGERPWFLGESAFRGMTNDQIASEMKTMDAAAADKSNKFKGWGAFQFETAYWKDGDYEKGLGALGLGDEKIGDTDDICVDGNNYFYPKAECKKMPVWCLKIPTGSDYGVGRAKAFAEGWGGDLDSVKTCGKDKASANLVV